MTAFLGDAPPPCIDCERPVRDWSAEQDLWQAVMGEWGSGHICADCFMARADEKGVRVHLETWTCLNCDEVPRRRITDREMAE